MSRIQVCCEGYERNPHIYRRCEPVCEDTCPNGICTAPNTCVCMPGHVRTVEGKCISTCPLGCGNGVCTEQNECRCREGYTLDPVSRKYCQPECNSGCGNGRCVAPNKCDCLQGFRQGADGSCTPVCDKCENGQCTAPGHCSCHAGYLKVEGRCEPICEQWVTKLQYGQLPEFNSESFLTDPARMADALLPGPVNVLLVTIGIVSRLNVCPTVMCPAWMVSALDRTSASASQVSIWISFSATFASLIVPRAAPMDIAVRPISASANPASLRAASKDVRAVYLSNLYFIQTIC